MSPRLRGLGRFIRDNLGVSDTRDDRASSSEATTQRSRDGRTRLAMAGYGALGIGVSAVEVFGVTGPAEVSRAVTVSHWLLGAGMGLCVALSRFRPAVALGLVVAANVASPIAGLGGPLDELALAIVTYNCARRGHAATLWASGAYVPLAYVLGGFYTVSAGSEVAGALDQSDPTLLTSSILFVVGVIAPLAVPWLLGLALRMRDRAIENQERQLRAEADRAVAQALQAKAEAIAQAREEQANLARDVHDVVGHSLAVILAQAESANYLSEPAPEPMRAILQNIIDSARASLNDVRTVLTPEVGSSQVEGSLDNLIKRLPAHSGGLKSEVVGTPRPLPPDTTVLATRVLQEMLTNALKHGSKHDSVEVLRDWSDDLRIWVSNSTDAGPRGAGMGLSGMRRRIESVGGRLEVQDSGTRFTVEARIPLGASRHGGSR